MTQAKTTRHRPPRVIRIAVLLGRAKYQLGCIDWDSTADAQTRARRRQIVGDRAGRLLEALGVEWPLLERGEVRP